MAGSFKDALSKSGLVKPDAEAPKPSPTTPKNKLAWKEPLDETPRAHVPFDAPAVTKVKPDAPKVKPGK